MARGIFRRRFHPQPRRRAPFSLPTGSKVPQNLVLDSKTDTQIVMSWDAVDGATGYDIERDGLVIATDVPGLTYTDTPLTPATTYEHRVRSVY